MRSLIKGHVVHICCAILLLCLIISIYLFLGVKYGMWIVVRNPKDVSNIIIKGTPLIFTALSVSFALKCGMLNIGVESQYIVGCIAAVLIEKYLCFPAWVDIIIIIIFSMFISGLMGILIGYLHCVKGINEVLTGIMLNWISLFFSNWFCRLKKFHKPGTIGTYPVSTKHYTILFHNFKNSEIGRLFFSEHTILNSFIGRTDFNIGIFIAVLCSVAFYCFFKYTTKGYECYITGIDTRIAKRAGMRVQWNIMFGMAVAGALSGLGASLYILGQSPHAIFTLSLFENVGLDGMAIAFLSNASPFLVLGVSIIYSSLLYMGTFIQATVGIPTELVTILLGSIVIITEVIKRNREEM